MEPAGLEIFILIFVALLAGAINTVAGVAQISCFRP